MKKRLLIVYHSATGGTQSMLDEVVAGANNGAFNSVDISVRIAFAAGVSDVLGASAIILGTPENFGYMSGALKDFFDRIYYPCLEHTQGLPYGCFIRAGNDGTGANAAITRIVTGLRWREVIPPIIANRTVDLDVLAACRNLGETLAAGLDAGIF
jgi:multimeric flavodoxin WrbA